MTIENVCLFPSVIEDSKKRARTKLYGAPKVSLLGRLLAAARLLPTR